jgi:hypothetical protein
MIKRGKIVSRKNQKNRKPIIPQKKNHRGQLDISFGMIFSIILIIVFLAFGFYAIKKFIDLQRTIQIESFLKDFQNDVDKMWKSPQGSQKLSYTLPTKISEVCFTNNEFENLIFTSKEIIRGKMIENIDIGNITSQEDPFCIQNTKGKVSFTIAKDYGETLVRVQK